MFSLALALLVSGAPAAPAPPPVVSISAKVTEEDGKPEVLATVLADGKPAPNVGVTFLLHRSFGDLTLGTDTTLDDGTAAAPFHKELAADQQGGWTFKITLTSPDAFAGQAQTIRMAAPTATVTSAATPRELWARHAPWSLLLTVLILVGSVWGVYSYTAYQLFLIKQGGKDA